MRFEIDEKVLKETTKCKKNFTCLTDISNSCCEVKSCVNDNLIFVDYKCEDKCDYKMSFGNEYICNCPTRKNIYKKNQV